MSTARKGSLVVLAALLAGSAGCGTGLSEARLKEANGSLFTKTVAATTPSGAIGGASAGPQSQVAPVDGAGSPAAAGNVATPDGASATGSAGADRGTPGGVSLASGGKGASGTGSGAAGGSSAGAAAAGGSSAGAAAAGSSQPGGIAGQPAKGAGAATQSPTGAGKTAGPKSEILLGSFGTLSGPIGGQMVSTQPAARAWVGSVNARGGLNGHPVRLIFGDDGGSPGQALVIAKRMVETDKVFAFYASQAPVTLQSVTPYLEQVNVPLIGGVSGNDVENTSPMVFNPQASPAGIGGGFTAELAAQTDKKKIAIFYCREAQTCSDQRDAVKKYAPERGLSIVYEAAISLAQPDYTAEIIAARNAGAEILEPIIDDSSYIRIAKAAHRQGWTPVLAGHHGSDTQRLTEGGPDVEGVLGFSPLANWQASPRLQEYRDAVARYVPGAPLGAQGAAAWAQGKLLEAVAASLGEPPTRDQLFAGLYGLRDETLGGIIPPITFNRGPHKDVNTCVRATKLVNGRWTESLGERWLCTKLH